MRHTVKDASGFRFMGLIENTEDCLAASKIAARCPGYAIDEDDEDYCDGARTCFNCRYRRWLADGFQCMKGNLRPGQAKEDIQGRVSRWDSYFFNKFALKDAIFLGFCATFIVITRAGLRLHLNIPGHAMFFMCFFLLLAVGCVPKMWAATIVGLVAGIVAVLLGMGQGGPIMLLKFLFPAIIVDCARLIYPDLAANIVACVLVGLTAAASRFLTIVAPDLLAGLDWQIIAGHAVVTTTMGMGFGAIGSAMVPAIVRRLKAHQMI
jgi:hypothetical protein